MATYRGECKASTSCFPTPVLLTEIKWWQEHLKDPLYYWKLQMLSYLLDLSIYVDASTDWGIGVMVGDTWAAFRLTTDWKLPGRDICWLETIAIEIVIYYLEAMHYHNAYILIHSDNKGAIGALNKACSPNFWINTLSRINNTLNPDIPFTPYPPHAFDIFNNPED
ncbi:hypothetical protein HHX47_DHR1000058 [Lentinula edodes]|nr:hypothetical protein HHX47_DHR1000058 [Lentinula edodes]